MSRKLVWVTNIANYKDPTTVDLLPNQLPHEVYTQHQRVKSQFIEGEPKGNNKYSITDMKRDGYVGLYKYDD